MSTIEEVTALFKDGAAAHQRETNWLQPWTAPRYPEQPPEIRQTPGGGLCQGPNHRQGKLPGSPRRSYLRLPWHVTRGAWPLHSVWCNNDRSHACQMWMDGEDTSTTPPPGLQTWYPVKSFGSATKYRRNRIKKYWQNSYCTSDTKIWMIDGAGGGISVCKGILKYSKFWLSYSMLKTSRNRS